MPVRFVNFVRAAGHMAASSKLRELDWLSADDQRGSKAMDNVVLSELELDEQILTLAISDEVEQNAGYCTHAWHYCDWPQ
jgi:hypothetical protein